jgi:uncharacterized membrane protein HdeD (DUF308 family)
VTDTEQLRASRRASRLRLAGLVIILLAAGAALLPLVWASARPAVVGAMLVAAGLVEFFAGTQRRQVTALAKAAGGVTVLCGLLFLLNPVAHFWPVVNLVIGWLLIRSVILAMTARQTGGSVRTWTILSAAMDFVLAGALTAGLSIGTLVVLIFGPTPQLVASFAWVLALSFVLNGLLQLEIAGCERDTG